MVVLAASIVSSKSGKVVVSRQFVDMSRIRIESLLAAFYNLVGTGKQHTSVETENVRFVYRPIQALYLLLVTNKESNILEDLDTLTLLSKLVPQYALSIDEEGICKAAFDLVFAFDEVISLGRNQNVTLPQVKQYCQMESHEEKLHKLVLHSKINKAKDVMKRRATEIDKTNIVKNRGEKGEKVGYSFSDMSIPNGFGLGAVVSSFSSNPKGRQRDVQPKVVTFFVEEKLNVTLKRNGGVTNFDLHGTLSLQNPNQEYGHFQVQIEIGGNSMDVFKTYPNMNMSRQMKFFSKEKIIKIGLKDPNRPFPTCQGRDGDDGRVSLLKWRMQSTDDAGVDPLKWRIQSSDQSMTLPVIFYCNPKVRGNKTHVFLEYIYDVCKIPKPWNVVFTIPLPSLHEAPIVDHCRDEWRYNPQDSVLEWSSVYAGTKKMSGGTMEIIVPLAAEPSVFFPISVRFSMTGTLSNLKVINILPLKGGAPPNPKYTRKTQTTVNCQIIF